MMKNMMKAVWSMLLAAVATGAFAADGTWVWGTGGTSIENPLDWSAEANWVEGVKPSGAADKATIPAATGVRYIRMNGPVELKQLVGSNTIGTDYSANRAVVVSDHSVTVVGGASPVCKGLDLYADLVWPESSSKGYSQWFTLCGDINDSAYCYFDTGIYQRLDRYANAAGEVRVNPGPTNTIAYSGGGYTFFGPQSAPTNVIGRWSRKAGSPFLSLSGSEHVLPAGTLVHGEGIPEGTFLKRVFTKASIELSQPVSAEVSDGEFDVTFDAFSPKVSQYLDKWQRNNALNAAIMLDKFSASDELTLTVGNLVVSSPSSFFTFDTDNGYFPGTYVLRNAAINYAFRLGTCHIVFEGTATKAPGFPSGTTLMTRPAAKAELTVNEGKNATIGNLTNVVGTIVKTGLGELFVSMTKDVACNTGALVAQEGVLAVGCPTDGASYVKTLAISNGATLRMAGDLRVDVLELQPGAIVSGSGTLTVATFSADLLDVTCMDGAQVLYSDTAHRGDIIIDPPATNVPGNPAAWFDAANLDSLTYADEGGVNRIEQWNDVRGAGILFATNTCATRKPQLLVASDEMHNCVYFERDGNTGNITNSYELGWNRKLTGICSVFKVVGCRQGGGQFLGQSSFWRNAEYGSYNKPAFCDSDATIRTLLTDSRFMVNGESKDWHEGYAYPGSVAALLPEARIPQVVELHLADGQTGYAQGFSAQENSALGRNGNQDLYELIVYTNRLTETERLAVTGYLMKKWLNSEANFETVSNVEKLPTLSAGQTLGIAAGTKMATESLSGDGTVVKTGGGTLYVPDCHSLSTSLKVAGGQVTVRSVSPTKETLPSGALLHLDAADETTYLGRRTSGDKTYLTQWGDARGEGHEPVYCKHANNNPLIVPDKLNGLPMVDFGNFGYANNNVMTCRVMTVRSIFTVQNSEATGGYLFGDLQHNCYNAGEMGFYGLIRYPAAELTRPIIWSIYSNTIKCFGPGATKTRLNGEDVVGTESYWSGKNDLLTVQLYEGVSGDSISHGLCNGGTYGGGKMIGELLYYENRLSNEDTKRIEAYLNKKWFNRETPGYRPAQLAAVDVAEGATLTLVGGAPIQVTSCSGAGMVEGGIRFAADADWTVTVGADGVSSALTVTGTFDVSSVGRLVLSGTGKAAVGSYVLATTGGIVGDVGAIQIDATDASDRRRYALRQNGNDIVLDVQPLGLTVIVR